MSNLAKDRPVTTLFMLMSLDGKISTGATDELDVDKDFPKISGVREGLWQYYAIEQTTDLWSMNSGRTLAKIGANEAKQSPQKVPVSFVIIDNKHLRKGGIEYYCAKAKQVVLVTTNRYHPAFELKIANLHIIFQEKLDVAVIFHLLWERFGCERLTIQCGGTLNSLIMAEKLFDYIDVVVAPLLVGGKMTPTLVDGNSLMKADELDKLAVLKLQECRVLADSYLRLRYEVVK